MIYGFFRWIFATALSIFYRWSFTEGAIPSDGPLLICGNHPNGLIDPVSVMRLTQRPVRFLAKAPIFKMPVLGQLVRAMRCLPVYRKQDDPSQMGKNDETFKAVHSALQHREVVCIFPEGKSHSNPALEPLKTGAARMALGAESEKGFSLGVRFVPVGFVYRQKGIFRSDVAVAVGQPFEAREFREAFEKDPGAAAHALTDKLDAALRQVTVNLESWEDLPLVEAAQRLYAAEKREPARIQRFSQGLALLRERDPARLESVRRRILALDGYLRALRLPADAVDQVRPWRAVRFAFVRGLELLLGVGPALAGTIAYFIPYQLIRLIARFSAAEEDIQASVKLGTGVLLMPIWTALLAWLGHHFIGDWAMWLVIFAIPICGLWALAFVERERLALADVRAYLALRAHGSLRERLLGRRKALVDELESLGKELGVLPAEISA